jgi:hypothetical protein
MSDDQTLTCRDCNSDFVFSAGERVFFEQRQFTPPSRCKACRQRRKAEKEEKESQGY